ncbi:MAG: 5-formyltetrahydrofolate cyclo-ligase [Xanthomonadales bacterium]|nr:5-formyltetrahydrofolate cyclo-ligase [Xanthomonadales bacterium]
MKTVPSLRAAKSELRSRMRRRRAALDAAERRRLDAAINAHLLDFVGRTQPRAVAAFLAFDGEPDLAPALDALERSGVRLAVPVVSAAAGRAGISFHEWSSRVSMRPNRYGIREPRDSADVPVGELDLVLVPLVAWDTAGGRLGMGASFYDRLFQPFAQAPRPLRMGVGYRMQQVEPVPVEPWDIRLHWMLTDDGCIDCRENNE